MTTQNVLSSLDAIENLPTLPVVAQQVLKLISAPHSAMGDIAQVIMTDQAISARVIALANSAFYGFSKRISSIRQAIVVLGLNTVKNLVIGVSVIKSFNESGKQGSFDRNGFWMHSFSTALAARYISRANKIGNDDDCFLAGLLHDIGILVLDQFFHEQFCEIIDHARNHQLPYVKSEEVVIGTTHGMVGACLGDRWGIPLFLVKTMRYHHTPAAFDVGNEDDGAFIALIHDAELLSREEGFGTFLSGVAYVTNDMKGEKSLIKNGVSRSIGKQIHDETVQLKHEWGL